MEKNGADIPERIKESAILTEYAVETRYPSPSEPVTEDEYNEAVKIAETVVQWVEGLLQK